MVTDLIEVFRLGTARARENLDFRRYLSRRHDSGGAFRILAGQVRQQIDCTACANCCRHSIVSVSLADIARIASYLGLSSETAIPLYTDPDRDHPTGRTLRTTADGCIFLDGNLCIIYDARPTACRDFPHISGKSHSLGGRPASHARWAPLCPIIFNALELHKHLAGFRPRP